MMQILSCVALLLLAVLATLEASSPDLHEYHQLDHSYAATCPTAEQIIKDTVQSATLKDRTVPAGLLRLHFHDCFVDGCDGSALLDSTPEDGTDVEKFAAGNNNSLRGFEVIDAAKTKLERACPGVVSCADIVAIAARDATVFFGGAFYTVPTGRFDGRRSSKALADLRLPSPFFTLDELKDNFEKKGLNFHDLILLSGGHTIGTSKCAFFESRIYNWQGTGNPDPSLDATYREQLRRICSPQGASPSPTVELDKNSQFIFDNSYYKNLESRNGLLFSDQVLTSHQDGVNFVNSLAQNPPTFKSMFAEAMIKMGNIEWKTSANGEIRKKCSAVNTRITTEVGDVSAI